MSAINHIEDLNRILDKAIKLAVDAHSNQRRKGSDIPYIVHPLETLAIVSTMTNDEHVLAASVLHDVVEDTDVTIQDIKDQFGEKVAEYVEAESEDKRLGQSEESTWKIRKKETIEDLKTASLEVQMITLGDKLSNVRSMYRDYNRIGDDLWQRFNQKDKNEHAWYYKSICDILSKELSDYDAYKEYQDLVNKVFAF